MSEYVIQEDLTDVMLNGELTTVSCFAVYHNTNENLEFITAFPTISLAEEYIQKAKTNI